MKTSTPTFNPIKTIKLINKDVLLKNVFNSDGREYNQMDLLTKVKKNELDDTTLTILNDIFETIIKNRETFLSDYATIKTTEKHPRRYGKVQIERDIENQGGIPTEGQRTMLAVNDLKNLFLKLQNKGVADHYKGTENFSNADNRLIRNAISTFEKQLRPVFNKKK